MISGREPDPKVVEQMLKEAPGPLNFTTFLTLFGEKTKGMSDIEKDYSLGISDQASLIVGTIMFEPQNMIFS